MKRFLIVLIFLIAIIALFMFVDKNVKSEDAQDLVYVWEKGGFGGPFTITLNGDGTYQYSVGYLSSYIGLGNWNIEDNILTMTETSMPDTSFKFSVEEGKLVFIEEESSRFMGVTVEDGDAFLLK